MGLTSAGLGKTVVLASADAALRQRLRQSLSLMRWNVCEAVGGAEAMAQMDANPAEALLLDHWLPDLEVSELAGQISLLYPGVEVLRVDGEATEGGAKSPRRNELLHALREAAADQGGSMRRPTSREQLHPARWQKEVIILDDAPEVPGAVGVPSIEASVGRVRTFAPGGIDDLIGQSVAMREIARLIRLVAPKSATVLIEGETGTGKEVVARALHRFSPRSVKPFVVLNCAAIPESLLEAELFGHTRGAFTGAVQSRTGRIEAANGGTLFLDEIGEMPLALQAKMLRFLESGELQRVGDNATMRVDVRVIAATHQHLEKCSTEGTFRLDLYHRLAVFPIDLPPLRERPEDIAALAEHFLETMGRSSPRKHLSQAALEKLRLHDWPGNVRELGHVLERAAILSEDSPTIDAAEIRLRRSARS